MNKQRKSALLGFAICQTYGAGLVHVPRRSYFTLDPSSLFRLAPLTASAKSCAPRTIAKRAETPSRASVGLMLTKSYNPPNLPSPPARARSRLPAITSSPENRFSSLLSS
jgi:hypothetical protein